MSGKRKDLEEDTKKLLASFKYPKSLFRFRLVSENSLSALQENKVYFSSANYYDDPFDTYLRVDISKLISEIKSTIENTSISHEDFRILLPVNSPKTKLFQGGVYLPRVLADRVLHSDHRAYSTLQIVHDLSSPKFIVSSSVCL